MALQEPTLADHASLRLLPPELVESLNQTYFLHLLVTDPASVTPPGKSLLSMLTHAKFHPPDATPKGDKHELLGRVKEVAHRAFWQEALESLSSPLPSVQLERLKRLYLDLHEALTPLFPPNHRILVSLSSPLPPTSSPLVSTLNFLREILEALRERCAPARDEAIDRLLSSILQVPTNSQPNGAYSQNSDTSLIPLAEFIVDEIRAIVSIGEDMKEDLNNFVLGSMTEAQLNRLLLDEVKQRKGAVILQIWGGQDAVRRLWRDWLMGERADNANFLERKKWIKRLFAALQSDKPVYCALPSSPHSHVNGIEDGSTDHTPDSQAGNLLPPQLLFSTPALLSIQNHIQAIIISAALRSLTRLPSVREINAGSGPSATHFVAQEFIRRVWVLLKAEIDAEDSLSDVDHTKLVNLADEVIRARQHVAQVSAEEEMQLRAAVERTLRSNDPVFLLLQCRLFDVLESLLVSESSVDGNGHNKSSIPSKMQTGRDLAMGRAGRQPKLVSPEPTSGAAGLAGGDVFKISPVAGFEDETLKEGILEVVHTLSVCLAWAENILGDLV